MEAEKRRWGQRRRDGSREEEEEMEAGKKRWKQGRRDGNRRSDGSRKEEMGTEELSSDVDRRWVGSRGKDMGTEKKKRWSDGSREEEKVNCEDKSE
ncbi:hypothetical protein Pcinc_030659 [Petrolisthes cinctipes]|uniref:Uncharacterized protein n=1 Tax=Petrolisthes cinctipes TaxID=88211 RepID=A0AAE1K5Q8_PETCI|nr:hypothetical protein Pcinc_030659 [Petrolisthes cinctipes]